MPSTPPPSPPGCAACKKCKPNCPFRTVLPEEKSGDYQRLTFYFSKKNLERTLRDVECDKRKDVLESMLYECKCREADPQFGCVGTLLELKQRCSYLETVIANLLGQHNPVLLPTLNAPESHSLDTYLAKNQTPRIPNFERFGLPIVFPTFLQEYLNLNAQNNNNFGGNIPTFGNDGSVPRFAGGIWQTEDGSSGSGLNNYSGLPTDGMVYGSGNNNNSGYGGNIPTFGNDGSVPRFAGSGQQTVDGATGSGLATGSMAYGYGQMYTGE